MELADELARNGVRVARDSFFLILNQEGKFELMPVDFGYMEVEINNPDYHINFDEHNPQYDDYFNIVSRDRGGTKMFVETLTVFFKRFEKEKVGNN